MICKLLPPTPELWSLHFRLVGVPENTPAPACGLFVAGLIGGRWVYLAGAWLLSPAAGAIDGQGIAVNPGAPRRARYVAVHAVIRAAMSQSTAFGCRLSAHPRTRGMVRALRRHGFEGPDRFGRMVVAPGVDFEVPEPTRRPQTAAPTAKARRPVARAKAKRR